MAISNEPRTAAPGGLERDDGAPGPITDTGGGDRQPEAPPGVMHIRVDRQDFEVSPTQLDSGKLTGRQIRDLAAPPIGADRDLFEIVPGGPDRKIEDAATVVVRDHVRFFSAPRNINPGAARRPAPAVPPRRTAHRAAE